MHRERTELVDPVEQDPDALRLSTLLGAATVENISVSAVGSTLMIDPPGGAKNRTSMIIAS